MNGLISADGLPTTSGPQDDPFHLVENMPIDGNRFDSMDSAATPWMLAKLFCRCARFGTDRYIIASYRERASSWHDRANSTKTTSWREPCTSFGTKATRRRR